MKQQCHISMVYLALVMYVAGVIVAASQGAWAAAAAWLIGAPLCQWLYIRYFPKFSTAMGYGRITDEPAEALQPHSAHVRLYTALGCPFCPLMEQRLEELRGRLGFTLQKVDVTLRPDILAEKGIRSVPAIEIGGRFYTGMVSSKEVAEAVGAAVAQPAR
jgi:glutaredoxin